ncbi:hypothetical protein LPJ61_004538 [Coemansia biformis]|uniref:Protein phosphatase n=1 Tax=Coemansia biformis TaxID=1286918 RepID=A0A9W7Y4N1_9FUNG|nr:hypothetical protein LPJ61_004538 [Coemansia biformis]
MDMGAADVRAPAKPAGGRAFDHQVAGHGGMLAIDGDEMIIKPLNKREQLFYEGVTRCPDLKPFMPVYYGQLQRAGRDGSPEDAEYICLENLVHGFEQPCIMDIKIGRRIWDLDATDKKREHMMELASQRTSGQLGVAVCGMKLFGEPAADRDWCRGLTATTLVEAISQYFAPAEANVSAEHRAYIISQFVLEVEELLAVAEKAEVRMYASSLLFVYDASRERCKRVIEGGDGDGSNSSSGDDDRSDAAAEDMLLDLRAIDFAHSHWMPGHGPDENYVDGLRSIIEILRSLPEYRSWDFPTLNSSFPFTIPTVPAGIFLLAQPGGHASMPSGVMMPAGLGTSARKFHSMSLTRQPGVPFDGDEDGGVGFTDTAALSAQLLRADPAVRAAAAAALRGRKLATAARRPEGASGASRARATKNYMFAHAATGIPKFENCVPFPRRPAAPKAAAAATAATAAAAMAGDEGAEEMAASAGEDAFFHRSDAMGIADGVGGWAGVKDADPSFFARRLMHHVCREVQRFDDIDDELFSRYFEAAPVDILRRAYEFTVGEMEALSTRGSSTACVVVLRGDELRVANLGDCGLTVVRQGDMVYRTEEQQHSFNYPYQLGTEAHSDKPSDAQVFRLKIQKGDIIIVGSDGVFDNLFDEDILEEVSHHLPPTMRAEGEPELKYSTDALRYESQQSASGAGAAAAAAAVGDAPRPKLALPQFHIDPHAISRAIAQRAKLVSEDGRYTESPFQLRAMQEGLYYQGGKRDDIAVIVAVVTDLEDTPDRR